LSGYLSANSRGTRRLTFGGLFGRFAWKWKESPSDFFGSLEK
jgi:hypothetical protein